MDPAEVSPFMSSTPRWVDPARLSPDKDCATCLVSESRKTGCWSNPVNFLAVACPSLPAVPMAGAVHTTERQKLELNDAANVAQMLEGAANLHRRRPELVRGRASTNETFNLFFKHVDRCVRPSLCNDQARWCDVRADTSEKPVRSREAVTTPAAVNTVAGMGAVLNQLASARSERRELGFPSGAEGAEGRRRVRSE